MKQSTITAKNCFRKTAVLTHPAETAISNVRLPQVLWRNRLLIALITLHILAGVVTGIYLGVSYWSSAAPKILGSFLSLSLIVGTYFVLWRFAVAVFQVKPKKPIRWMISDFKRIVSNRDHASDAAVTFLCIIALTITYSYLKGVIPLLNTYSWDPLFAQLDRTLHGGHNVWEWLWPVLGSPYLTTAINAAYHGWFMVIYLAVCVACFDRRDPSRSMVFLVAFTLCWSLGGNLLGTVLASVGPVYYQPFGFGDTFAPQMELLRASHQSSPVWALEWHQMLLDGHFNDGPVRGISAMPSMHVATTVLVTIYGFTYARWLGWMLTAFTVVILLGSVHLAWHYAVDGYASIMLAFVFWWLAKWLTARFGPTA